MIANLIKEIFENESGQGITEYGATIAFVALTVATIFAVGHGSLLPAIKNSFSGLSSSMNQLAAAGS